MCAQGYFITAVRIPIKPSRCTSDPNLLIDAGNILRPTNTRIESTCNRGTAISLVLLTY